MAKEINYKLKKSKTVRLSDSAVKNINYMVNDTRISESELLRSIIEKAIDEYRLKKALDAVKSGKKGISGGAEIAGISYRAFYEKMIENGVELDYGDYNVGEGLDKIKELVHGSQVNIKKKKKANYEDYNIGGGLDKVHKSIKSKKNK